MNSITDNLPVGAAASSDTLSLMLRQVRYEAQGINSYELIHPLGEELPPFEAGAHIDVHIRPGLVRQYSLCNSPAERHRYVIGVLQDKQGRGGSKALHEQFRVQESYAVSAPRNHFSLQEQATHSILIAGGIGITPLKAMAHALEAQGKSFELHYCARTAASLAFRDELESWEQAGRAQIHLDNGNPDNGLDLKALLKEVRDGAHVYYCGPQGFMQACADAAQHWPDGTVHFEHFQAPVAAASSNIEAGAFVAKIASTGQEITVGASETLSDALANAGVTIPTSCVSGLCGTCKVNYLSGEVEHQDYILNPSEQSQSLTACVSRGKSGTVLVLDL